MNNSKLAIESVSFTEDAAIDTTPHFRERESDLTKIIEAIQGVKNSKEWSTLKTHIFDDLPLALTKELQSEARKETPDTLKLNRLAGQLKWAEKYSDLYKLEQIFRLELTQVRTMLYGKKEHTG